MKQKLYERRWMKWKGFIFHTCMANTKSQKQRTSFCFSAMMPYERRKRMLLMEQCRDFAIYRYNYLGALEWSVINVNSFLNPVQSLGKTHKKCSIRTGEHKIELRYRKSRKQFLLIFCERKIADSIFKASFRMAENLHIPFEIIHFINNLMDLKYF